MKYLIMQDFSGRPAAFIFPRRVDHADMRAQLPYSTALSGGLLEMVDGRIVCSGGNAELNIKASPGDQAIIEEALRPQQ